jgi:DNA-binding LacI/PurR family transcriptional regulator
MVATLADVARVVGCSNATVSRVINKIGPVSPAMRDAVERAMRELNYVPRPSATPENGDGESKAAALLEIVFFSDAPYERISLENRDLKIAPSAEWPPEERLSDGNWLSNSFYRLIVDGIIYEAPFWGLKPTIQVRSTLNDAAFLAEVNGADTAGVLLLGQYSAQIDAFTKACAHPLVLVDLLVDGSAPVVTFDNLDGIAKAFEHLYALGHRSFGFLAGLQSVVAYRERLTAFRLKMVERNLPIREEWIYTGNQDLAPTGAWAEDMLRKEVRPTAFLCANDFMAIALTKAATRLGLSIPRDFSVVGFDDIEPASLVTPALTTVRVPTFEAGRQAVQQISVQLKLGNRRNRRGTCVRLTPELIVRESTEGLRTED